MQFFQEKMDMDICWIFVLNESEMYPDIKVIIAWSEKLMKNL